jgi:hypothetical protein
MATAGSKAIDTNGLNDLNARFNTFPRDSIGHVGVGIMNQQLQELSKSGKIGSDQCTQASNMIGQVQPGLVTFSEFVMMSRAALKEQPVEYVRMDTTEITEENVSSLFEQQFNLIGNGRTINRHEFDRLCGYFNVQPTAAHREQYFKTQSAITWTEMTVFIEEFVVTIFKKVKLPEPTPVPAPAPTKPTKKRDVNRLGLIVEPGTYNIGDKRAYIRVVGTQIMVRTGGGWQELREWLGLTFGVDSEVELDSVFTLPPGSSVTNRLRVRDVMAADAVFAMDKNSLKGKSGKKP